VSQTNTNESCKTRLPDGSVFSVGDSKQKPNTHKHAPTLKIEGANYFHQTYLQRLQQSTCRRTHFCSSVFGDGDDALNKNAQKSNEKQGNGNVLFLTCNVCNKAPAGDHTFAVASSATETTSPEGSAAAAKHMPPSCAIKR
jgi:hypothetical protein